MKLFIELAGRLAGTYRLAHYPAVQGTLVVQIMADQASINGRDRGNGFRDCITQNFPDLILLKIPTRAWSGEDAAAGLETILNSTPDLYAKVGILTGLCAEEPPPPGSCPVRIDRGLHHVACLGAVGPLRIYRAKAQGRGYKGRDQ